MLGRPPEFSCIYHEGPWRQCIAKQPETVSTRSSSEPRFLSGEAGRIVSLRVVVAGIGLVFLASGFVQFGASGTGSGVVSTALLAVSVVQMMVGLGLLFVLRWAYYGALVVLAVNLATAYLTIRLVPLAVSIAAIGILLSYSGADWQ